MAVRYLRASISLLFIVTMIMGGKGDMPPQVLFQKLKNALKADNDTLYQMQKAFFPLQGLPRDYVYLNVTVGRTLTGRCAPHSSPGVLSNFTYCQSFQWSSSPILDLISNDQFLILDNVLSRLVQSFFQRRAWLSVELQIDSLPSNVSKENLLEGLLQLLNWAKAYARVHGPPDANDKGYVSLSFNDYVTETYNDQGIAHFYRLMLLCAFVFLNILTPIVLPKIMPQFYPKMKGKASTYDGCLYWATAFTTFIYNFAYTSNLFWNHFGKNLPTITSCIIHLSMYPCTIPASTTVYGDEVNTLFTKVIIIPIAVFVDLCISIYTVRCHFITARLRYNHRYHCLKHYMLQSLHVLALWNILITIQLATMTAIPLGVLLLTHTQVTILLLIFLIIVLVGLTPIVAYLMYQCQQPRRRRAFGSPRHCAKTLVHLVLIIAILGVIMMLLVLYELMLLVQVQAGIKGLVLSLLPSLPLTAVGWYLKWKKSQRKVGTDTEEQPHANAEEPMSSTAIPNPDNVIDQEPFANTVINA